MTKEFYRTGRVDVDHTTFGGIISYSDYEISYHISDPNGYHTMANIASQIERDLRFDKQCKRNIEKRDNYKNYKKGIN